MGILIRGIGLAVPEGAIRQDDALQLRIALARLEGDARRFATAIHERSGIDRRGSVLCTPTGEQTFYVAGKEVPGTAARMQLFAEHAPPLAAMAATNALQAAGLEAASITHLITTSCTGFFAPGLDIELIERLRLSTEVQRLHIGFMGCHAAINALGAAHAMARGNMPEGLPRRVLVTCVELSSLHMQYASDPEQIVVGALFADGASACVVEEAEEPGGQTGDGAETVQIELLATASTLIPDSKPAMQWHVGDCGFRMTLGESIPELIRAHLAGWLQPWIDRTLGTGVDPAELGWCVHPGGPRVLEATRDAMGLPESAMRFSRASLREHGNMSSASVLFILERMRAEGFRGPVVILAFGPGVSVEAALVRLSYVATSTSDAPRAAV